MMRVLKLIAGLFIFFFLGLISSCSKDPEPFNCELTDLSISLSSKINVSNCSTPDGSILVIASAGKEPYIFFLNDQTTGQATGEFTSLSAGIYSLSVKDGNSCIKSVSNVEIVGANFSFSNTILEDTECLGGNGQATIAIVGGNPPYTYNIAGSTFSDVNTFVGLSSGNHIIGAKDVEGCFVTLNITVPKGKSNTSWANDIQPIVQTSCSKSGCHDGSSRSDLRIYANAKKLASQIKSETQSKNMPREGSITQSQIDLIACWVDDGALDN